MAGRELYVYYRVPAEAALAALAEVQAAQNRLRQTLPGLETGLLKRPDVKDGLQTWMEIYRHPDGLDGAQQEQLQTWLAALPSQRASERHVECFESLPAATARVVT
jgi:hypothetical protein